MTTDARTAPSWKRCGVCKRDLGFDTDFYECSVSTCTSARSHPVFCSIGCWDQHVPVMRHRDAWAEQKRSPTRAHWEASRALFGDATAGPAAPTATASAHRRIVVDGRSTAPLATGPTPAEDVLVVASKLKAYIRARSGMNTADSVLDELSHVIREHADRAIEHARVEGRRTVMDRDFKPN